jgi:hypothetical protein
LTSRIVEHIRHQSPELPATNDPIVQALRKERRQMWNRIEELERERPLLTPLVTVSRRDPELMRAVENAIRPLRPLSHMIGAHNIVWLFGYEVFISENSSTGSLCLINHYAANRFRSRMTLSPHHMQRWCEISTKQRRAKLIDLHRKIFEFPIGCKVHYS